MKLLRIHGKDYTIKGLAEMAGVSTVTIRDWIKKSGNYSQVLARVKKRIGCESAIRSVKSCAVGAGKGHGNQPVTLPIRERSWVGCTFKTRIRGQANRCLEWLVLERRDNSVLVECIGAAEVAEYMVGAKREFLLSDKCLTPEYLPDPETILAERDAIKSGWSDKEKAERCVEKPGEVSCEMVRHFSNCSKRRK